MRDSPAFRESLKDPALRGNPFFVYVWCDEHLDYLEYRFVKHRALERELSMRRSSIADAIAVLVSRGYLSVGPRDGRLTSYRLYHARPSPKTPPADSASNGAQTGVVATP